MGSALGRARRVESLPLRDNRTNSLIEIQHRISSLKNAWSIWEDILINLRVCAGEAGIPGRPFQEQKNWRAPFHSPPQPRSTDTHRNQCSGNILHLTFCGPDPVLFCRPTPTTWPPQEFSLVATGPLWQLTGCQTLLAAWGPSLHSPVELSTPTCPWQESVQTCTTSLAVCEQPQNGPAPPPK